MSSLCNISGIQSNLNNLSTRTIDSLRLYANQNRAGVPNVYLRNLISRSLGIVHELASNLLETKQIAMRVELLERERVLHFRASPLLEGARSDAPCYRELEARMYSLARSAFKLKMCIKQKRSALFNLFMRQEVFPLELTPGDANYIINGFTCWSIAYRAVLLKEVNYPTQALEAALKNAKAKRDFVELAKCLWELENAVLFSMTDERLRSNYKVAHISSRMQWRIKWRNKLIERSPYRPFLDNKVKLAVKTLCSKLDNHLTFMFFESLRLPLASLSSKLERSKEKGVELLMNMERFFAKDLFKRVLATPFFNPNSVRRRIDIGHLPLLNGELLAGFQVPVEHRWKIEDLAKQAAKNDIWVDVTEYTSLFLKTLYGIDPRVVAFGKTLMFPGPSLNIREIFAQDLPALTKGLTRSLSLSAQQNSLVEGVVKHRMALKKPVSVGPFVSLVFRIISGRLEIPRETSAPTVT